MAARGEVTAEAVPRRFGALRDRHSRPYLFTAGLSMLGDNNEHVITYWMLWQRFHSPALVGFEVISHWLPFLVLSVPFGVLAERYDCRRLVQAAQGLFMLVSIGWGVLLLTDSLQVWEACVLLLLHGCAGALWAPAEQMLLHDFADRSELPSIVRLNATFRGLGTLCGPIVGAAMLLGLGPTIGIFANVLFYLPMTGLMLRTPYTGHIRSEFVPRGKAAFRGMFGVLRTVQRDPTLVGMVVLAVLIALTVGSSLQVSIPSFASRLGAGSGGFGYGALLLANGIGGVLGGFLLEAVHGIHASTRTAAIAAMAFGATTVIVAASSSYALVIVALVIGGVASLASQSTAQAVVQLRAPLEERGRVVGVFNMFGQGFRVGNGIVLATVGSALGVAPAVMIGGAVLGAGALLVGLLGSQRTSSRTSRQVRPDDSR